jgi:hypothetical protein
MPIKIRPIRTCGDVAYVPLTQGYEAIIDAADVMLLDAYNWHAAVLGCTAYAQRCDRSGARPRTVLMHRIIMGEPDGLQVDHLDGDGIHNRRKNLRLATSSQNNQNRRITNSNTSGFKGVYLSKTIGKWCAQITISHKQKHLGTFTSPEEAHAAYRRASKKYHGEFGRTE